MRRTNLKALAVAAIACCCMSAPVAVFAQRYDHNAYRYNRNDLRDQVNSMERESNSFRAYFEHNFRDNGHQQRWDRNDRYGHPEHEGRNGQMTLQDAIQNLDEDFERLRSEVDRHGRTRQARSLMDEIQEHSRDVDVRINRVADNYRFNNERGWRYDRSELSSRWRDLRGDINELARRFGGR